MASSYDNGNACNAYFDLIPGDIQKVADSSVNSQCYPKFDSLIFMLKDCFHIRWNKVILFQQIFAHFLRFNLTDDSISLDGYFHNF